MRTYAEIHLDRKKLYVTGLADEALKTAIARRRPPTSGAVSGVPVRREVFVR